MTRDPIHLLAVHAPVGPAGVPMQGSCGSVARAR